MWNSIDNEAKLENFMNAVYHFHDSCIKEIKYVSGAHIDESLAMHPINDRRTLNIIIQRQYDDYPVIELEFSGLKRLKLVPVSENYTCEILGATMMYKDELFYWYDCDVLSDEELANYEGTVVCASGFRWRPLDGCCNSRILYTLKK